jgi:Ran GTPase-activating protein (RanGAP) involved in mRNA processing and transport
MKKGVKDTPSKVLLWSRLGLERPCFLVVGYLIKRFGMTLENSLHMVKQIRAGTELSPLYMEALQEWSNLNTIGELLCVDCIDSAKEIEKKDNENSINQEILGENYAKYKDYTNKYEGITSLGDPQTYIQRVYLGEEGERRNQEILLNPLTDRSLLIKLIDLNLNSKRLGDNNIRRIFNAIRKSGIGNHLRVINLRENGIKKDAMFSIVDALAQMKGDIHHELMHLDLSNNNIGHNGNDDHGSQALASLVRDSNSITYLNVNNNNISDEGAKSIFDVLGEPLGFTDNDEPRSQFNQSMIELHMESNSLAEFSGEAIMDMVKSNKVLIHLYIDDNPNLPAKMIKHIANSLRIYNSTIETINVNDIPLSPKSAGYLIRVLDSTTFPLSKLSMCRCQMTSLHISPFSQFGKSSKFLTNLDLSCNNIGDTGAEWVAVCLKGTIDRVSNTKYPPLKKLDLNCCGIEVNGIQMIIEAAAESPLLKYLDISDNDIGSNIDSFKESLSKCYLSQLHLNRCKLTSKGVSEIFELLKYQSNNLTSFLKVLCLSSNEIMDSSTGIIVECLNRNMVIEVLDLGFNQFSDLSKPEFNHMTQVSKNAKDEIRLITLNVNMIGNNCGDYSLLEVPGQTRSKMNYRFGRSTNSNGNLSSAPNDNYNYIPALSRDHLLARKYFDNRYLESMPENNKTTINFVS